MAAADDYGLASDPITVVVDLGLASISAATPVASGGSGASTPDAARANLDVPSRSAPDFTAPVPIAQGGTSSTTAPAAKALLGAASAGTNSDITSIGGLTTALSVAQGGTSGTSAAAAKTALSAASAGANSDITSITGLTTALALSQGGVGSTTAAGARTNLGAVSKSSPDFTAPVPVAQGGIGATTSAGGRSSLGAATAGSNSDITGLLSTLVNDLTLQARFILNTSHRAEARWIWDEYVVNTTSGSSVAISNAIPNHSILFAVQSLVLTNITHSGSSVQLGTGANATLFSSNMPTTNPFGTNGVVSPVAYISSENIFLTCVGGTFSAGQVRIAILYLSFLALNS